MIDNIYHVYPMNDDDDHDLSTRLEFFKDDKGYQCIDIIANCKCHPKIDFQSDSGAYIIVHNSFDGREGVEWANEILNNQ